MLLLNFDKKRIENAWQIIGIVIIHKDCIMEINNIMKFKNLKFNINWICVFIIVRKSYNANGFFLKNK